MTDCHTRRNTVRIDHDVGDYTFLSEGHVFLLESHTDRTFLTVPGGELVSDLWDSDGSHFDFGENSSFFIDCDHN